MRLIVLALLVLFAGGAGSLQTTHRYIVVWAMESNVYPGDGKGHDFLAVFDLSRASFGRLVAMLPVPTRSQMAHHANYELPPNGLLFANDFTAARSYVFDIHDPAKPRLAAAFGDAGLYSHPHSFAALANGNVLATYQQKGSENKNTGALVELDTSGHVLRSASAASVLDPNIRPYSLTVLPKLDRVVTTSADMMGEVPSSHVVQVWRLSDLKLLQTLELPSKPPKPALDADEARVLSDGTTVMVQTSKCGLYELTGLAGEHFALHFAYDLGYRSCSSVPVVAGNYWIEASMSGHCLTSFDMSDPAHPREVSRLYLGPQASPHWLSRSSDGSLIAITGFGSLLNHISFASVDSKTGVLTLTSETIDFKRKWPDGWDGPAVPHAVLFD